MMRISKLLFFVTMLLCFSLPACQEVGENKNKTTTTDSTNAPTTNATSNSNPALTKEQADLIAESAMDFWAKNKCTRGIPKAIVHESQRGEGYSFNLDKIRGRGIEQLTFDKDDELTVTNKGCTSVWVAYSFALNEKVHELDITDQLAVSKKMLSLVEFASTITTPPLEIKGRLPMLDQVIDQVGPFEIGQEFLFTNEEIKEGFTMDKVEKKNGKLLLDFSFSRGPI